jgi:citrate lyase subunit beta / citryl-CoA lyase
VGSRLRTALFVPGDRPERIFKAVSYATDAVVVDLEDAVAEAVKHKARDTAVETIEQLGSPAVPVLVRVNASDTQWFDEDLSALGTVIDRLWGVVLPMATTADDVIRLEVRLSTLERSEGRASPVRILPIVETAQGVLDARAIASASERVETLVFGAADLSMQMGVGATADGDELLYARSHVVLAAAAANTNRPLDGPYLELADSEGLRRSAANARRLGFGGKAVIHPAQLEAVTAAFAPSESELRWARAVDEAFTEAERAGRASIRLDNGTFVDYPVARRARAILAEVRTREVV